MKLIVAITGASGVGLAAKFIQKIPKEINLHVIISENAQVVFDKEKQKIFKNKYITLHDNSNIGASIASGSFGVDAMIILPTSTNTLAKVAVGIADNLITRAASIMIKEHKKLILAVREIPYSSIVLDNMSKLSNIGVIMASPNLAYYSNQQSLEDMENFLIGKWFDLLGIKNNLYTRWNG